MTLESPGSRLSLHTGDHMVDVPAGAGEVAGDTPRPLVEGDIQPADQIFRLAFGTFLGSPIPCRSPGTQTSLPRAGELIQRWPLGLTASASSWPPTS